jgi:hypothetical protein
MRAQADGGEGPGKGILQRRRQEERESAQEVANASTLNAGAASQPQVVAVALPAGNSVKVPSLIGMPVRQVVEQVALAGLNLQVEGRGLVRSQEPQPAARCSLGIADGRALR